MFQSSFVGTWMRRQVCSAYFSLSTLVWERAGSPQNTHTAKCNKFFWLSRLCVKCKLCWFCCFNGWTLLRFLQESEKASVCSWAEVSSDHRTDSKQAQHLRVSSIRDNSWVFALCCEWRCVTWGQPSKRHNQPPRPSIVKAFCELPCWLLFLTVDLKTHKNKCTQ